MQDIFKITPFITRAMLTLHRHIGIPFCTHQPKWRLHPGCYGHYPVPFIFNKFRLRQACALSCMSEQQMHNNCCRFMWNSMSIYSCGESLASLTPVLNTILVHSTIHYEQWQILAFPHQHTMHFWDAMAGYSYWRQKCTTEFLILIFTYCKVLIWFLRTKLTSFSFHFQKKAQPCQHG